MNWVQRFLSATLIAGLGAPSLAATNLGGGAGAGAGTIGGGTVIVGPVKPAVDYATKQGKSITDPNDAYIGNQLLIHDSKSDTFGQAQFGGAWKTNFVLWAYKAGTAAAPNDTAIADIWFTTQGKVWNHNLGTADHPLVDMWTRAVARNSSRSIDAQVYWNGKLEQKWSNADNTPLPSWSLTKTVSYNQSLGLKDLDADIPLTQGIDVKFDTTGVMTLAPNIQVTGTTLAFVASPRANVKVIASGGIDVAAANAKVSGSLDPLVDITYPANVSFRWTRNGDQSTATWSTSLAYTLAYLKGSLKIKGSWYDSYLNEHKFDHTFWDSVGYTQAETLLDLSHSKTL